MTSEGESTRCSKKHVGKAFYVDYEINYVISF